MSETNEAVQELEQVPTGDIRDMLSKLREQLEGAKSAQSTVNGLTDAVGTLYTEHMGMVNELLGVYEQLGMVFDVAKALPSTETPWEVLEIFLQHLQRAFPFYNIGVYCLGPDNYMVTHGREITCVDDLDGLIDEAIEQRGCVVHPIEHEKVREIMISPIMSGQDMIGTLVLTRDHDHPEFRASDMSVLGSLSCFCGDLVRNQRLVEELRTLSGTIVQSLVNAIDQKDEYTAGHSTRVAFYADMLGRQLKFSPRDQRMLQWSALLHDVGKIGIRDDVLKKRGPLSNEEFDHMKEHPARSHEVVCGVPQLAGALDGVRYHHERFDGKGYPLGLEGENIPLQARVVQIADVFDALTSSRSYRSAFTWEKALGIMQDESGTTLDPDLQQRFDKIIRSMLADEHESWEELTNRANNFSAGWQGNSQPLEGCEI